MLFIDNTAAVRDAWQGWRQAGETVGFVPTMGNLHDGHLSLLDIARQRCDRVVVSIFVNPKQFAPGEDFDAYPRTPEADRQALEDKGVDMVFAPTADMIFPRGEQNTTFVDVPGLSDILEGEFRPGFFRGVATVVLKLFNIVQPDVAVFGEKDFQQLLVIRRMVVDLDLPVEIVSGDIIREGDGLAMSSRNAYLEPQARQASVALSQALQAFKRDLLHGDEDPAEDFSLLVARLETEAVLFLQASGFVVDYFTLRQAVDLSLVTPRTDTSQSSAGDGHGGDVVVLVAARMGTTRLIDNLQFSLG